MSFVISAFAITESALLWRFCYRDTRNGAIFRANRQSYAGNAPLPQPGGASHQNRDLGSLSPGKLADLVVLERDIFSCDPMDIQDARGLGTMVGGEWKYHKGLG